MLVNPIIAIITMLTAIVSCILMIRQHFVIKATDQFLTQFQEKIHQQMQLQQVLMQSELAIGKRCTSLMNQAQQIELRLDMLEQSQPSQDYLDKAKRMLANGAKMEDIIATCGISETEAHLMTLLA